MKYVEALKAQKVTPRGKYAVTSNTSARDKHKARNGDGKIPVTA